MKIAFNPSTVAALTSPPDNKDITFDLRGHNIFARGVKFQGTDTNTWRDIKINNVSIGSHTLDLRNGSNTTLTNTNGVVIINSTWRPVVDNLTSNSTTSSLSANQGRVLAGLINGKSDSDHNHDGRYVKKSGDIMLGALNFANNTWNKVGDDVYMGDHNIGGQLCIMGANGTTGLSFHKYGDTSIRKSITFDGNTLYMNGSCDYATLSNQTNLLAINTVPNKTAATSIGSWSPISGRYVFHQKWTDTSTGGDAADFGIYLDGNLTANMVLDGYYNSLLGFRVIGATGGFLKANGTIDNSTYLTSHQSLSNYYTKGEIDNQLGKYKLKSSIWVPETKVICSNFRDFLNKENLHKQAQEELNLYRFYAQGDESNYSSKYNYPVVDSHAMVFSIDGNNGYIRSMNFDLRSNDIYVTSRVAEGEWRNWVKLLDSSNYSGVLDSRYYTESEVNSLLDAKLNRQNLSYGNWNPRGYNLAADYFYNGGDLSISENSGQIHVSIDGYFWQNEGRYRVLDTSDVVGLKNDLTVHQYLSSTDTTWYPLIWGGGSHANTNDSTGAVCKSRDVLSWQTSSQTLYATNIRTENIRHLSIGGGIYWNPNVESASDGSDAASITLVKSGVAGGTTLVLSQMNDANDTIQFKTNAAARLYHNSYPILTIQNTYVSNGKGYINGTEITQVNNSDTIDGWHKNNIQWTGYITSGDTLASYWFKMYDITVTGHQYNDITITFLVSEGYSSHFSIFYLRIRQEGTNNSGNYNLYITLYELVGNLRDKVVAYYNNSTGNVQLWGNTGSQWGTMNYTVLKKTTRIATDSASLGTLTAQSFSSVQTPPSTGYYKVTMSRVGSVSYSDSTGSVNWNNVTNKPSAFNPATHTHTVFKNNLMIKGTNGISDNASIHLGIGDSDTGFKWISDGVCQMYANNVAIGQWTSGGMNWFANPTVNGNKVWNAGNDGSGSGLDADKVDGEHASNFSYTHQTSFDFSKSKSGRIVTFDQSGTDYGWINGFASTHNNYLTSIIFNAHRTSNWYVGYIEANTSTGVTKGLTAVKQLAFLDSTVAASNIAYTLSGKYTNNGGQQKPNYFGKNRVGALMMNTPVNGDSNCKDWLLMDCYGGNDAGGGVAFGVNRQTLGAYIMRSNANRESWTESAELVGTHNFRRIFRQFYPSGGSDVIDVNYPLWVMYAAEGSSLPAPNLSYTGTDTSTGATVQYNYETRWVPIVEGSEYCSFMLTLEDSADTRANVYNFIISTGYSSAEIHQLSTNDFGAGVVRLHLMLKYSGTNWVLYLAASTTINNPTTGSTGGFTYGNNKYIAWIHVYLNKVLKGSPTLLTISDLCNKHRIPGTPASYGNSKPITPYFRNITTNPTSGLTYEKTGGWSYKMLSPCPIKGATSEKLEFKSSSDDSNIIVIDPSSSIDFKPYEGRNNQTIIGTYGIKTGVVSTVRSEMKNLEVYESATFKEWVYLDGILSGLRVDMEDLREGQTAWLSGDNKHTILFRKVNKSTLSSNKSSTLILDDTRSGRMFWVRNETDNPFYIKPTAGTIIVEGRNYVHTTNNALNLSTKGDGMMFIFCPGSGSIENVSYTVGIWEGFKHPRDW